MLHYLQNLFQALDFSSLADAALGQRRCFCA